MIEKIVDVFYPKVCGACGKITKESICSKCQLELKKYQEDKIYNYTDQSFTRQYSLFRYEGKIRQMLISYKFGDQPYLYESFVNLLLKDKKIWGFFKSCDIIIPVPVSKKRKRKRGYDQMTLLAKGIAKKVPSVSVVSNVLQKEKDTISQSTLQRKERKTNVVGSYTITNTSQIQHKKVLLLDDIFTTGSTAQECSRILKLGGAKEIQVITIAKDY